MRKHKTRVYVAPADSALDLRDDDLLQIEQVSEEWIYENQYRADAKKVVFIHTCEFEGWPADLSGFFAVRLVDLDELAGVPEFYSQGYRLVIYREHPDLQQLIHLIAECIEL